nr:hypothetical protein [uncultured Chryseobacterium sp.]
MIELFKENIGTFLSLVVSGSAGWFFGRRKLNAEVEGMDADNEGKKLENDEKLVNLYKEALDDLGNRYEAKFKEFSEISERKIKLLEEEINIQKHINEQLRAENIVLKTKLK